MFLNIKKLKYKTGATASKCQIKYLRLSLSIFLKVKIHTDCNLSLTFTHPHLKTTKVVLLTASVIFIYNIKKFMHFIP